LVTRELSVLLWSLVEDGEGTHMAALLAVWRQLMSGDTGKSPREDSKTPESPQITQLDLF